MSLNTSAFSNLLFVRFACRVPNGNHTDPQRSHSYPGADVASCCGTQISTHLFRKGWRAKTAAGIIHPRVDWGERREKKKQMWKAFITTRQIQAAEKSLFMLVYMQTSSAAPGYCSWQQQHQDFTVSVVGAVILPLLMWSVGQLWSLRFVPEFLNPEMQEKYSEQRVPQTTKDQGRIHRQSVGFWPLEEPEGHLKQLCF